jgi:hypothetical protein
VIILIQRETFNLRKERKIMATKKKAVKKAPAKKAVKKTAKKKK